MSTFKLLTFNKSLQEFQLITDVENVLVLVNVSHMIVKKLTFSVTFVVIQIKDSKVITHNIILGYLVLKHIVKNA